MSHKPASAALESGAETPALRRDHAWFDALKGCRDGRSGGLSKSCPWPLAGPSIGWRQLLHFTRRERDVFDLLVRGHSNKNIAKRLAISARTVEDHRAAIVAKTRTNGLAQLVGLSRGEAI
jgi:DNA-binding CsgD family transcriptional regulator